MARRNYKFTDKKHTRQGLMSMGMGAAALVSRFWLCLWPTECRAEPEALRACWAFWQCCSVLRVLYWLSGDFREEDVYYAASRLGRS